jgi:GAF domain-containing protein
MLRLLIDENFDHRILLGLKSRLPLLNFMLVRDVGLGGLEDSTLLRWAAQNRRTILTHDIKTMPRYAKELLDHSELMAGVIVVPAKLQIGRAIRHLELLLECFSQADLQNQVVYLPLA